MEGEIRRDSKGNMLREREGERSDGVYYFVIKKMVREFIFTPNH